MKMAILKTAKTGTKGSKFFYLFVIETWLIIYSMKISILFPNKELNYKKLSDVTVHDLGMEPVIKKLSGKETERAYILGVMRLMSDDGMTARFRADVFADIKNNKKMREDIVEILDKINFLKEYGSFKHDHDHEPKVWDLLHRLGELGDYISGIEAIYSCLDGPDLKSKGLLALKKYVTDLYHDNGFDALKKDISQLRTDTQHLKSVTLGVNLNERFEACGIGIVSLNNRHFTKSMIVGNFLDKVSGKDSVKDGNEWNGDYRFQEFKAVNPMDSHFIPVIPPMSPLSLMGLKYISESDDSIRSVTNYMDEITERMLTKTVRHLRDVLARYTSLTITDITDLMPEFIYYIRWAEYIEKLEERGFKFCMPVVYEGSKEGETGEQEDTSSKPVGEHTDGNSALLSAGEQEDISSHTAREHVGENTTSQSAGEQEDISAHTGREYVGEDRGSLTMDARGIFNMKLLEDESAAPSDIITNNLTFSNEQNLYILTGANRGGKTTITQAVGQLFFMAQGGIFVTGTKFEYSPVDAIYTHFPADEDKTMDLGRLGEECKRFKELYQEATDKSLLLLNETFSTTSFEEGYYIAYDCCRAILKKGIRTIYNTHMHKLAMEIESMNGYGSQNEKDSINGDDSKIKKDSIHGDGSKIKKGGINEGGNTFRAASLIVRSDGGERSYKVEVAPPTGMSYAMDIAEKYGVTLKALTEEE